MNQGHFLVKPDQTFRLKDHDPGFTDRYKSKAQAAGKLRSDIRQLAELQELLYAGNEHALLIVLQGMDTAGKDGTIRHVMSGVNPQGTQVSSFRTPSAEELDHDYLWRSMRALPERGNIGIFNRSYYEEVLIVRVHPEVLKRESLPPEGGGKSIWKRRFREIVEFERYLVNNGIVVLKFFLNISREEQKRRLLARINTPGKNWKVSHADASERAFWDEYMTAFTDAIQHTSSAHAPWHVIPADNKWFAHAVVADIIVAKLKSLNLSFPVVSAEQQAVLLRLKALLDSE